MKNIQKEQTEKTENAQKEWKSAIQVSSGLHKRNKVVLLNKLSFLQGFENKPARTIGEP